MNNMNWGVWLRGLIASISSGCITVLAAIAVLQEIPEPWKLFIIGGVPLLLNFFSYIKESPPPLGYKVVLDPDVPVDVKERVEKKVVDAAPVLTPVPAQPQPSLEEIMKKLTEALITANKIPPKEGEVP